MRYIIPLLLILPLTATKQTEPIDVTWSWPDQRKKITYDFLVEQLGEPDKVFEPSYAWEVRVYYPKCTFIFDMVTLKELKRGEVDEIEIQPNCKVEFKGFEVFKDTAKFEAYYFDSLTDRDMYVGTNSVAIDWDCGPELVYTQPGNPDVKHIFCSNTGRLIDIHVFLGTSRNYYVDRKYGGFKE